jgi:hypothetical protein
MTYLVEQKAYITQKGNRMSEIEVFARALDQRAINAAWPITIQKRSVSNTGDWLATEYEYAERIGNRPLLSEARTQQCLEQLIDLLNVSRNATKNAANAPRIQGAIEEHE